MAELVECFLAICNPQCITKCFECPGSISLGCCKCIGFMCSSDLNCCRSILSACTCKCDCKMLCCCVIFGAQCLSESEATCLVCLNFSSHLHGFSLWHDELCGIRLGGALSRCFRNVCCWSSAASRLWISTLGCNIAGARGNRNRRKVYGSNDGLTNYHQIKIATDQETEINRITGNWNRCGEDKKSGAVYPVEGERLEEGDRNEMDDGRLREIQENVVEEDERNDKIGSVNGLVEGSGES